MYKVDHCCASSSADNPAFSWELNISFAGVLSSKWCIFSCSTVTEASDWLKYSANWF